MQRRQKIILGCGTVAVLILSGIAWGQSRQLTGPRPSESTLIRSRADAAALAQARQSPLAARIRSVLDQDQDKAGLMRQAGASAVPVLAPPDPGLLDAARLYPGDRQYTLTLRRPGQIIEIFGSTLAFTPPEGAVIPAPAPLDPLTARRRRAGGPLANALAEGTERGLENIRSERTEYGWDVSFGRFGAAYSVTFVCDDPATLECSEAAAVQFASGLELIGGGQ